LPLWYPAVSRFASTLKKLTLAKGFNLNPSVLRYNWQVYPNAKKEQLYYIATALKIT
jgi:hypothetical protein